jgi:uncharacterized LabA/DUF88 family protein
MFRRKKKKQPAVVLSNAAFIDNQNLNLGVQRMGWKMDWKKLRLFLKEHYNVDKAYMFIGYMPEYEDLYQQMHEAGYLVVLKPTLEMYQKPEADKKTDFPQPQAAIVKNDEKKVATKGNIDADLVLYAVKEMANYHKALIVSGDGDFYSLIEYLAEKKKLLHVLAPNWQYSTLLKPFESYVVRLDNHRKQLAYRTKYRGKPKKLDNQQ